MNWRNIFGVVVVLIVAFLAGAIALGHVEEKTSYGLMPLLLILDRCAGKWAAWAFAVSPDDK